MSVVGMALVEMPTASAEPVVAVPARVAVNEGVATTVEPTVPRVEAATSAGGAGAPNPGGPITSAVAAKTAARTWAGFPTAAETLANARIAFTDQARDDIANGLIDRRVLALLTKLAKRHTITVTVLVSGHSRYVKGTERVSNHINGRGVDIGRIDGVAVNASSEGTYDALNFLLALPDGLRPDELGGPWDVDAEGRIGFTDAGHRDHLHVGYDA